MSKAHTPPNPPPPAPPGEPSIDLVAGDPPVPITVWRTPPGDDQASIPTRLAQRLIAAYSRPGEAVIDLTDDHALSGAALAAGRRHHPGRFTAASRLIVGGASPEATGTEAAGGHAPGGAPTARSATAAAASRRRRTGDVGRQG
jgi:hypothetical protein